MHNSRLIEKPRLVFLGEMAAYRRCKQQYYRELYLYEETLERMITEEIAAIKAGLPVPSEPVPRVPVHPVCVSRYVTSSDGA